MTPRRQAWLGVACATLIAVAACSPSAPEEAEPSAQPVLAGAGQRALDNVNAASRVKVERFLYPTTTGTRDDRQNWADVYLPPGTHAPSSVPLVVLVHGGSWQSSIGADSFVGFSRRLAERGLAVYNVEYRRIGSGGGWPTTFKDVAAALDYVPVIRKRLPQISDHNSVVVGHSAGGQLAMWAGTRHNLPDGAIGSNPKFRPQNVVSLAGPLDMRLAVSLGDDRIVRVLGGTPQQVPDRYRSVDPIQNVDPSVPILAMVGTNDHVVPPILSKTYVEAVVEKGGWGRMVLLPETDHVSIVTPSAETFPLVIETISRAAHNAYRR